MDKSRQQFESFIKKETGFDLHRTNFPMTKREDQQYSSHQTNLAWLSWQASRESLINNLEPVAWMYPVFHDDKMQFTTDAVTSENIDIHFQSHGSPFKVIPLYRLDK